MKADGAKRAEISIEPATAMHFQRFYSSAPQQTVRAVVAVREDEVIGVAGVYARGAGLIMFAELTDELRRNRRAIVRGIRHLLSLVGERRLPVHAIADPQIPGSARLLEHIGFRHNQGSLYTWQC